MKIMYFSDFFYPELSGVADSVYLLGKTLAAIGHEILFAVPKYSRGDHRFTERLSFGCDDNVKVIALPSLRQPNSPTGQSRLVIPTGKSIRAAFKFKPDIIHSNSPFIPGLEALAYARFWNIPIVGTNHTHVRSSIKKPVWLGELLIRYVNWYFRNCDIFSVPGAALLREMGGTLPGARIIPNAVDCRRFRPAESEAEIQNLKSRFGFSKQTILYTGRLAPEKNVNILLKAFFIAGIRFPDAVLAIAGRGQSEGALKKYATELGISNRVKFLGFVPDEILPEVYRASDIFVIMSTAEWQSLSLMQAMASGLPVIGANAKALPEYIRRDCGILIEPKDYEGLALSLELLLDHPDLRQKLAINGRIHAEKYDPAKIAAIWLDIYEKLLRTYGTDNKPGNSCLQRGKISGSLPQRGQEIGR